MCKVAWLAMDAPVEKNACFNPSLLWRRKWDHMAPGVNLADWLQGACRLGRSLACCFGGDWPAALLPGSCKLPARRAGFLLRKLNQTAPPASVFRARLNLAKSTQKIMADRLNCLSEPC